MWLAISVVIVVITSYIAFKLGAKIFLTDTVKKKNILSLVSALTMGLGIWSMHFVGMLAINIPGTVHLHPFTTLLSIFPGILGSFIALCLLWRLGVRLPLPLRGTMFGACILVMNYIGMTGMNFDGYLSYSPALFVLSIIIAVILSYLALYIYDRLQNRLPIVAALGIGLAVSVTHYTGIEAAYFIKEDAALQPTALLLEDMSAVKVSASLLFLTLGIAVYLLVSKMTSATNQLRDTERRWKFAIDAAGDGVWDWNPQTDKAMFSRRWNEILGYAENEFTPTGAAVFKAIHPDDVRYVKKGVLEHVRKGGESPYKREFRMQTRDGDWKWVIARGKVLERDTHGSPVRMIGTLTDITERKQSEIDLLSSKRLLQSIIDRAPIRVFWKDRESRFLGCNILFAKDAGFTHPDQLIGKTDDEMGWKEQAELYRADDIKVIETGEAKLDFEEPQTTPDGRQIWLRTSKVPLLNPTTEEIIGVLGLYEDITKRKQAENELRLSKAQLSEAQRIAKTGSWTLDLSNNHLDWSDEVYRLFEIDKTQFNSSYEAFLDAVHPDDREMVNQAYLDSLNSHKPYEMTHRILVGDGHIKYVHETCETLFDKDGKALLSRGTVQDITERKQAEDQMRIAAVAFESQQGIMVTDAVGIILQVNSAFMEMSGYTADEIIGNTPKMFQSGRHGPAFYEEMWQTINSDGFWQGEIWDRRKNGEVYPKLLSISAVTDTDGKISHYVGSHADITEKKSAEKKIDKLAYYDQLTGLPNKVQFMNRLEQTLEACVRDNQYSAILMIDLDHFQKLNDTLGHVIGDQLLVQVASLLEESTSSVDTVARFGGDKFVVILPELASDKIKAARTAEKVTRNILHTLNKEYQLGRSSHHSTVSIGVNLFGSETLTIDVLLKQAELAMYESKSAGRNTMTCYDPKMQSSVSKLVTMEKELRSALENEEFFLDYQPQASLQNDRIISVEALIRWNSPKLGLVSPDEFIPVLEEMELIVDVGNWVLGESCECLKRWHQSGFDYIRIGINVSPAQFKNKNFLDTVRDILKKTKVPPGYVELEITEGVVMDDPQYAESLLNDLHKLGLKIAIDDFGTGYSSLSNLMHLPFDTLKIDRAFVKELPGNADSVSFCNAILALAKALKLHTIAEGVENVSQLRFLNRIDCTIIQGFYFSKPLPPQEIEKMLSDDVRLSVSDRRSDFSSHEA
ncbi:hypothetical protein BOV97_00790 [Solemya velum gill symbiont]|nr:hypothetical protein BOV97_00790 [Solemya velum gill symbiont]OOY57587.1 hypothetical protein BOV99_00845 [Solemya velum gill symbiont]OOY58611.1 hypothetical protein BOW00_00845 [Solemya velum gill symbiont]OOY62776.1 hypothetical protein BOW04_03930 [Solemya velum gill symbiont]OOY66255.1 hypothetical protein BOW05_02775 [Solemya velum gill symbiont]